MFLVKIENGNVVKFPYTLEDLRADNPMVSFPGTPSNEVLAEYSAAQVFYYPFPEFDDRTQYVSIAQVPVLIDGIWSMQHTVVNKTTDEIAAYDTDALTTLRSRLTDQIDARTDDIIMYGFVYLGQKTRLNALDQNNFQGAYDMIKDYIADGVPEQYIFPWKFKVWTDETTGAPVFRSFNTFSDLKSFIYGGKVYIQACLAAGWTLKTALSTMTLDGLNAWTDPRPEPTIDPIEI